VVADASALNNYERENSTNEVLNRSTHALLSALLLNLLCPRQRSYYAALDFRFDSFRQNSDWLMINLLDL
jgi:hypothetical protein